jgi:hypothetical protein
MNQLLALPLCVVFVVLALWHFYMALSSGSGHGAVPVEGGTPLFVPSTRATLAVGVVLLLVGLSYALAAGLAARAVGEFRYVGFFKRVRGSRFARLDTNVYSPLCLLLAAGVAYVAHQSRP